LTAKRQVKLHPLTYGERGKDQKFSFEFFGFVLGGNANPTLGRGFDVGQNGKNNYWK
tara:strand:- start:29 stop:199 length:171 start_codon:yes stop_codon:yes gene_type:complete